MPSSGAVAGTATSVEWAALSAPATKVAVACCATATPSIAAETSFTSAFVDPSVTVATPAALVVAVAAES